MEDRPGLILAGILLLAFGSASIAFGNNPAVPYLPESIYGWPLAGFGVWFLISCHPFFADGLLDVCTWMDFGSDDGVNGEDLF